MSLPLSVLSQSGPPKSVGGGGGVGGGGAGRIPHFNWSIYRGGNFFFFFFFFFLNPGSNWTKNRLRMVSKVRNVRLGVFSGGGCHHPNSPGLQHNGGLFFYWEKFDVTFLFLIFVHFHFSKLLI